MALCPHCNKEIDEPPAKKVDYSRAFMRFWKAYPAGSRSHKKECFAKWRAAGLDDRAGEMVEILEAYKQTKKWRDGFVRNTNTFFNNDMWDTTVKALLPCSQVETTNGEW